MVLAGGSCRRSLWTNLNLARSICHPTQRVPRSPGSRVRLLPLLLHCWFTRIVRIYRHAKMWNVKRKSGLWNRIEFWSHFIPLFIASQTEIIVWILDFLCVSAESGWFLNSRRCSFNYCRDLLYWNFYIQLKEGEKRNRREIRYFLQLNFTQLPIRFVVSSPTLSAIPVHCRLIVRRLTI